MANVLSVLKNI
jgi:hypothetical protein